MFLNFSCASVFVPNDVAIGAQRGRGEEKHPAAGRDCGQDHLAVVSERLRGELESTWVQYECCPPVVIIVAAGADDKVMWQEARLREPLILGGSPLLCRI